LGSGRIIKERREESVSVSDFAVVVEKRNVPRETHQVGEANLAFLFFFLIDETRKACMCRGS